MEISVSLSTKDLTRRIAEIAATFLQTFSVLFLQLNSHPKSFAFENLFNLLTFNENIRLRIRYLFYHWHGTY